MRSPRTVRAVVKALCCLAAAAFMGGVAIGAGAPAVESGHLPPSCQAELDARLVRLERELMARRKALPPLPPGPKSSDAQWARDQALMKEAHTRMEQIGKEIDACVQRVRQQHRQPQ